MRPANRRLLLFGVLMVSFMALWSAAAPAWALERFPPPDFSTHKLPTTEVPPPLPAWREYLDFGLLLGALGLATYLALVRRWRAGLLMLTVGSLVWFGFVREGCVCPIGATQNVTLALCDGAYAIPWVIVAFFVAPVLVALFFGRTFCAAVCPLGAVQELVILNPKQLPRWVDQVFGLLAFVYLGLGVALAAIGAAFVICRYDPFVALFRREGTLNIFVIAGCFLVVGLFIGRPYCRFLCPYGAILGLVSKVSQWQTRITPTDCIQCRLCEEVCPYGAIRPPTVPPSPAERRRGRTRLGLALLFLPVLIGAGLWLGQWLKTPLARVHPTVRLAERIFEEDTGRVQGATDASDAFRNSGQTREKLFTEAETIVGRARLAGILLGGWVGLVIGGKLVQLNIRRRRNDYTADPAKCVSCGRCYRYCPREQERLGLTPTYLVNVTPPAAETETNQSVGQALRA
ncbi:MAG: 4Fe-4S binding protein [Planctomycetota bacterium]